MSTAQDGLVLGPELAGALLTPEEFDATEDFDERYVYELINGVLVVTPPPSPEERGPNDLLTRMLWNYHDNHPLGTALNYTLPEHRVRVRGNRRRADRVVWAGLGRMPDVNRDPVTIVIEFVSAGRRNWKRDYEVKRREYLEASIAEYWLIDRFRRQMTVFRGPADRPMELVVGENEVYRTPLLPGFELPLSRVLREADAIREAQAQGEDTEPPAAPPPVP